MRARTAALLLFAACSSGEKPAPVAPLDAGGDATCTEPAYPAGPYGTTVGARLADRTWTGVSASGTPGTVSLHDAFAGCAADPPLLVLRVDALWCGTCRSYAAHSERLLDAAAGRVRFVDVVLYDRDNAAASGPDAQAWQALEDVPTATGVDPPAGVAELLPPATQLPVMLLVDARTMTLESVLSNPTEDALEGEALGVLAAIDGTPATAPRAPHLFDGRFSRDQWDLVAQMALTTPPPPDPSDAVGDSNDARTFGKELFADTRLSPSNTVACRSCHEVDRQLSDGFPTSPEGVGRVPRNAPSLSFAAYTRWSFYDGRADSLWSQALGPMEAPNEFGSSRLFVAHAIHHFYPTAYATNFGAIPPLDDLARFPPDGKPGDAAYDAMSDADKDAVTRVFVNAGKAIEAYERSLRSSATALDRYAGGQLDALTDAQKDGLRAFLDAGCAQCHWGPRLTDDAFHVLRFPGGSLEMGADPGRQAGIPQLVASAFDLGSKWSDDPSLARPPPAAAPATLGAFKTPQLRNVALTAPYGHGGNYASLTDVVELIRTGGMQAGSALTTGTTEPWVVPFDPSANAPIATFLASLDSSL